MNPTVPSERRSPRVFAPVESAKKQKRQKSRAGAPDSIVPIDPRLGDEEATEASAAAFSLSGELDSMEMNVSKPEAGS